MSRNYSIFRVYLRTFVIMQLLVVAVLGTSWIHREFSEFDAYSKKLTKMILERQDSITINQINTLKSLIYHKINKIEPEVRKEIEIYSDEVLTTLLNSKNNEAEFINNLISHNHVCVKAILGDQNIYSSCPDNETFKKESESINTNGDGYVYNNKSKFKYSYIRSSGSARVIVSTTGENYIKEAKEDFLAYANSYRYGNNYYIFGGTWKGISIAGPVIGKNMINVTDVNGIKIVQELINISKNGSGFLDYTMPGIDGNEQVHKRSFVIGIPEWEIYIGTGVLIPNVNKIIAAEKQKLYSGLISNIIKAFIIIIVLSAGAFYVFYRLYVVVKNDFNKFSETFARISYTNEKLDRDNLKLWEFKQLSDSLNIMIYKREQHEREIRFLNTAVNSAKDVGFISTDRSGTINFFSIGAENILNLSSEEAIGANLKKYISKNDIELFIESSDKAWDQSSSISIELNMSNDGYTDFPADVLIYPIQNHTELSTNLVYVIKDISNKKQLLKALKQSEKLFKNISEYAPTEILFFIDNIIYANSSLLEITGYTQEQIKFIKPWELNIFKENESQKKILLKRLEGEKVSYSNEITLLNEKGETRWVSLFAEPTEYDGRYAELINMVDITLRKKTENELNNKTEQLEKLNKDLEERITEEIEKRREKEMVLAQQSKLAAMGEMIGAIAHQWRQPLNSLAILIQDIQEAYHFNELSKDYINDSVEQSMKHILYMSSTIDDFRDFNKQDKDKYEFCAKEAVKVSTNLINPQFSSHDIELYLDFDESNPECSKIFGYVNEFKQVIINILTNAKDAFILNNISEDRAVKIKIDCENDSVIISIQDNAGGIPDNIRDRIFEPYFTTKLSHGGTGIGLYMAKTIIESHMNGKLTYESTINGSLFIISIPKV